MQVTKTGYVPGVLGALKVTFHEPKSTPLRVIEALPLSETGPRLQLALPAARGQPLSALTGWIVTLPPGATEAGATKASSSGACADPGEAIASDPAITQPTVAANSRFFMTSQTPRCFSPPGP